MQAAGIICEYNPFHTGHKYQIEETKKNIGSDGAIVCLMSGGFVQRGQCAMFDKYVRAEAAVRNGADLVLELPVTSAISSAEGFASGAVDIMQKLGFVDVLSFGCESGNTEPLKAAAEALRSEQFGEKLRNQLDSGISFAAARQAAVAELDEKAADALSRPNDILAVEYIKALNGTDIAPLAVARRGAEHDGVAVGSFNSASEIRRLIAAGDEGWKRYVPEAAVELIKNEIGLGKVYSMENAERAVLYRLRTMTNEDFDALPFGSEGLNIRLMHAARSSTTTAEVLEKTKTKRYAHSRIRRMMLCAYLGITVSDITLKSPYVRVLAFNDTGRKLIRQSQIPLLQLGKQANKMGENAKKYFTLECRCSDLLSLCLPPEHNAPIGEEWIKRSNYI